MTSTRQPCDHRAPQARAARIFAASVAVAVTLTGCSRFGGLSKIDRQVEDVLADREQGFNEGAEAPAYGDTFRTTAPEIVEAGSLAAEAPYTTDPDASELTYDPADGDPEEEARGVAERLERYADTITPTAAEGGLEPISIDLEDALSIALDDSREIEIDRESYLLSAIQVLLARRLFTPRLFNETSANFASQGDEGRFDSTVELLNRFGVTQNLRDGGRVAATWLVRSTEDLSTGVRNSASASSLVLSGEIPLLRGAGRIGRENLIQTERDLIYAARTFERRRRFLLLSFASDYFGLLQAQAQIQNQERQLASFQDLARQTRARVEAGRLEDFQIAIAQNQVLAAQSSLANLREGYIVQLDFFKIRLGIGVDQPVEIRPIVIDLDGPRVTLAEAVDAALRYRLDLQTTRNRIDDAKRAVENARNGLLPDLGITGEINIPTGDEGSPRQGVALDAEELAYNAGISLSLPLDRDDERLRVRESQIRLEQARRQYTLDRDNIVLAARQAVREIDLARFRLRLAEEQVRINERRVAGQELNKDSIEPQILVDTQNDLINAENARDAAVAALRIAILEFLFDTGQLRVADSGLLEPLDGMVIRRVGPDGMMEKLNEQTPRPEPIPDEHSDPAKPNDSTD